jgi:hypothetical protein
MHAEPQAANPFALLTDPEAIFRAMEASPHLEGLNRRVCRPLDRAQRGDGDGDGNEALAREGAADRQRDPFLEFAERGLSDIE